MKKVLIITISVLFIIVGIYVINYGNEGSTVLKSDEISLKKDSNIAIMLMNQAGDGYYESNSDTFPVGMSLNTTLSSCENGGTITYDGTNVTVQVNKSDKCYVFFDIIRDYLADHIINIYTNDGWQNLYYHDKAGAYATYEAGDYSYRYSGASASVANYVCFGSDADTCPTDNLYRIIGLFKNSSNKYQAKLIKASLATTDMLGTNGDYASGTNYYWNYYEMTNSKNNWNESLLNKINLNTNYVGYLNAINSKWMNMVDTHTWIVGGNTLALIRDTAGAQNVYYREITSPSANTTYSDEIGLMYVSDYMYGASPTYWNKMGYNNSSSNDMRAAINENWMYIGSTEWTITRRSDGSDIAFYVYSVGIVVENYVYNAYGVRPVFYLNSDVSYAGGTGTSGDPYRISG